MEELSEFEIGVIPRWKVANALGAALARTTCEVQLHADTEQGVVCAPEEGFRQKAAADMTRKTALPLAFDLLRRKAIARGANIEHLEMEVVEAQQFNMVRGFRTTGRNIRLRVQVKPGLIHGYDPIAGRLI